MSCPVADGTYKVVHEACFGGNRRFLYEDLEPEWKALGVRIKADAPKVSTKRLRGFYCIEVMYHLLFPSLELPTELVGLREQFLTSRFQRDYAGLGEVIHMCRKTYSGITIAKGEMQLSRSPNNLFEHMTERMDIPRAVSAACEQAARALRPMLRGPTNRIGTVGRLFGEALTFAHNKPETAMRYLHTMLDVSIHNPVSPWSMTNSQASPST